MMNQTKIKNIYIFSQKIISLSLALGLFLIQPLAVNAVEFNLSDSYGKEIWELNQSIEQKRQQIDDLKKQAETYKQSLARKQSQLASLNYQVAFIDQTVKKISLEAEALQLEVETTNLKIENSQLKIQATENQIADQKGRLSDVVRTLYYSDKENNLLAILATNDTLSGYVSQMANLQGLEDSVYVGLDKMSTLKIALVEDKTHLDQNKKELEGLQQELEDKTDALSDQRQTKNALIVETRGEESKYQTLLRDLKAEQDRANNDIVQLEQVAREKLNRQIQNGQAENSGPMIWPIDSRRITAYFHDPDYPYRAVFEHPAIDIATPQGTPIKAVSSGYVARAKDAGKGYSYIMLVHDDGLSTVYGHVSGISVSEGSFVTQGQIIGLSGGKPGTPGAGLLTSGPHLHFEVRLNGIPVNPRNYLP